MSSTIREVLRLHARLSVDVDTLQGDTDLYLAGMTSHATVNVMLALEVQFGIEFPDQMLRRAIFESIDSISAAIETLGVNGERLAG